MKKILSIIGITFLLVIVSIFVIIILLLNDYKQWEKDFESSKMSSDYITTENSSVKETLENKIVVLSQSKKTIDYIELTKAESMYLFSYVLSDVLPKEVKYEKGFITGTDGAWEVFLKLQLLDKYPIPWIKLEIIKDNIESPEIYVKTIVLGNYDFNDYGLRGVVTKVNKGIIDALNEVNLSSFTGRKIINIELDSESMIIKASQ